MSQIIRKTIEFKLYPTVAQATMLSSWLKNCCWIYNRCLEQRAKAWSRRKENISSFTQMKMLTELRSRIPVMNEVPAVFQRSAIRRVDFAFKSFFRRCQTAVANVGYPRFKSVRRYHSMEYLHAGIYFKNGKIRIPCLGSICARGDSLGISGVHKALVLVRRASGWYAQIFFEVETPEFPPKTGESVGIDLGLTSFLTTDAGEQVGNPRLLRNAAAKLKRAQQSLGRKRKDGNRRKKAVRRVALIHERVKNQRKGFCHRISKNIVSRFDRIAIENLNVKGMARGRLAKSVHDAAWSTFIRILTYKAANAGRELVRVDPRGTSQTCPGCGDVKKKKLSERQHECGRCHLSLDRDYAAAIVVRDRAFRPERGGNVRQGLAPAVPCEA